MKRTLLLTALSALFFANTSQAQIPGVSTVTKALPKVDLGIKLGANFQELNGDTWKNAYKAGFLGGAFVGLHKNKIGVQAEVLVKSVNYTLSFDNSSINTVGLDVPVLFEYRLVPRLWLQAGPQFSMLLSAKDGNSDDVKKDFKSSDVGGVLGLEVKLPFHLEAGARYILGFTNINNNSLPGATEAWKNRTIQLYVGFRFL